MMVLGAIFRCIDPILTIAAALSSKPLFLNPLDKREEAGK
jgi:ATP-dependent RNA helicase DHX57